MLHHKLISKSHTAILILFFVAALTYATQHALASSNANDDTPAPSSQDIASLESFGKPGEAVDLGLSVSWCEYNIGASDPSDPGLFFGYGDLDGTETSTSYADYPSQDVVGTDRDPAYVYWGQGWRMPTKSEIQELCNRCDWKWTQQNGIEGYLVKGRGGSIFLPVTGQRSGSVVSFDKTRGYYWAGELTTKDRNYAAAIFFYKGNHMVKDYRKCYGFAIRPVKEDF